MVMSWADKLPDPTTPASPRDLTWPAALIDRMGRDREISADVDVDGTAVAGAGED